MQTMTERLVRFFIFFGIFGAFFSASLHNAIAQESAPAQTIERRLDDLDQKIKILDRKLEIAEEKSAVTAKEAPIIGAETGGFFLKSADSSFQLKIGGYIQADGRFFIGDEAKPATNTFLLRRVRPVFEGTVAKYVDFRILPDFGSGATVLQDAYLDFHYWPFLKLRIGQFKTPFGLERLQSGTNLLFVERAFPTSLAPNRDIGLQLHGDLFDGSLNYALGVFNGVVDGGSTSGSDANDEKDYAARIFIIPFKNSDIFSLQNLGIGVAGTWGDQVGSNSSSLPSFKTPGQQTFFKYRDATFANGTRQRLSPQIYYYAGPFGLLSEYVLSSQDVKNGASTATLKNDAWQVALSYVLTGEDVTFKGIKPKSAFGPGKEEWGWGAFEVAARYHELNVDNDAFPQFADLAASAREAKAWAAGLNWYVNRNVKVTADYEQTKFKGGQNGGKREDEKIVFTRFQVVY